MMTNLTLYNTDRGNDGNDVDDDNYNEDDFVEVQS